MHARPRDERRIGTPGGRDRACIDHLLNAIHEHLPGVRFVWSRRECVATGERCLEEPWVADGEFDVGAADSLESLDGPSLGGASGRHSVAGRDERFTEALASDLADACLEVLPAREVPIRGRGRHADAPREVSDGDRVHPTFFNREHRSIDQRRLERTVVIGAVGHLLHHASSVDTVHTST